MKKRNKLFKYKILLLTFILLFSFSVTAFAKNATVDPFTSTDLKNWNGNVIDASGNVKYNNMSKYMTDPNNASYLKANPTSGNIVFTFDPGLSWNGALNHKHINEITGRQIFIYSPNNTGDRVSTNPFILTDNDELKKNTFIRFRETIDSDNVPTGYHTYNYSYKNGEQIPLAGWVASFNWRSIHHNNMGPIGTNGTYAGFENFPYTYRDSCGQNGIATSYFPICAYCGKIVTYLNFYGSLEAHAKLPMLQQGASFIYNCRHNNGTLCNGAEMAASINHTNCVRKSANQYTIQYHKNIADSLLTNAYTPLLNSAFYYNDSSYYNGEFVGATKDTVAYCPWTSRTKTFLGWSTSPTGTVICNGGDNAWQKLGAYLPSYDDGTVINLYAIWGDISSTVTIRPNGGTYSGNTTITQKLNTTVTISNPTPPSGYLVSFDSRGGNAVSAIRQGKVFSHWTIQNAVIGRINGTTYTFANKGTNTLTANYLDDTNGIILPSVSHATNPTTYHFTGWYNSPTAAANNSYSGLVGQPGQRYFASSNVTLYAGWSSLTLTGTQASVSSYPTGYTSLSWWQDDTNLKTYRLYKAYNTNGWSEVTLNGATLPDVSAKSYTSNNSYTVTYDGVYNISVIGSGGTAYGSNAGGKPGIVTITAELKAGDIIYSDFTAVPGGAGGTQGSKGGNASYVYVRRGNTNYPIAIAAGGGGASAAGSGGNGGTGTIWNSTYGWGGGQGGGASSTAGGGGGGAYIASVTGGYGQAGEYTKVYHSHTTACTHTHTTKPTTTAEINTTVGCWTYKYPAGAITDPTSLQARGFKQWIDNDCYQGYRWWRYDSDRVSHGYPYLRESSYKIVECHHEGNAANPVRPGFPSDDESTAFCYYCGRYNGGSRKYLILECTTCHATFTCSYTFVNGFWMQFGGGYAHTCSPGWERTCGLEENSYICGYTEGQEVGLGTATTSTGGANWANNTTGTIKILSSNSSTHSSNVAGSVTITPVSLGGSANGSKLTDTTDYAAPNPVVNLTPWPTINKVAWEAATDNGSPWYFKVTSTPVVNDNGTWVKGTTIDSNIVALNIKTGIKRYGYLISTTKYSSINASTPGIQWTTGTSIAYTPPTSGTLYIHVIAQDNAGNVSATKVCSITASITTPPEYPAVSDIVFDTNPIPEMLSPTSINRGTSGSNFVGNVTATGMNSSNAYMILRYANSNCLSTGTNGKYYDTGAINLTYGGTWPMPTCPGFKFDGWMDPNGTIVSQNTLKICNYTGDMTSHGTLTLKAKWSPSITTTPSISIAKKYQTTSFVANRGDLFASTSIITCPNTDSTSWTNKAIVNTSAFDNLYGLYQLDQIAQACYNDAVKATTEYLVSGAPYGNAATCTQSNVISDFITQKISFGSINPADRSKYTTGTYYLESEYNLQGSYIVKGYGKNRLWAFGTNNENTNKVSDSIVIRVDKTIPSIDNYTITQGMLENYTSEQIKSFIANGTIGQAMSTNFTISVSDYNDVGNGKMTDKTDASGIKEVRLLVKDVDNPSIWKSYSLTASNTQNTLYSGAPIKGTYSTSIDFYSEFPNSIQLEYTIYAVDWAGNMSNPYNGCIDGEITIPVHTTDKPTVTGITKSFAIKGRLTNVSVKAVFTNDENDAYNIADGQNYFKCGDKGHVDIWTYGYVKYAELDFYDEVGLSAKANIEKTPSTLSTIYNMGLKNVPGFTRIIDASKAKKLAVYNDARDMIDNIPLFAYYGDTPGYGNEGTSEVISPIYSDVLSPKEHHFRIHTGKGSFEYIFENSYFIYDYLDSSVDLHFRVTYES